jgi:site-specific DNA-methyltransferase (adenine-specific)
MKEVGDRSIHLIVTSPPYWQLKDYGEDKQIGFNDTYEAYINNLNLVWMECQRVLHYGCRLCINIGDQFARSVYYGRYKIIPIRTEIIKFCETIGFDYMGAIIWQKVTTCNTTGGATIMGSFPYPRNGIIKIDYEFILIFKKYGEAPPVSAAVKEQSRLTTEEWNLYFNGHWNFPGEKQDKHLAMFPEELPRRLIRMFSFKGDTVLDPFLGSGTTSLAARNLGRNSVGYEINPAFLPIIEDKLGINQSKIFETTGYEIIHQKDKTIDFNERISSLPYAFKDPIKFDKKVDPKKMSFGSRIDDHPRNREELFAVEKIVSPEIMILDNGLKIRLLGIKAINDRIEQAIDYLREKTKGQKIFLRFDSIKHDKENNLLCYVYLKNRLFLNAHLIKEGLAEVETSYDFKYKVKFEKEKRELNA